MTTIANGPSGSSPAASRSASPANTTPLTPVSDHDHTPLLQDSPKTQAEDIATKAFQFLSTATPTTFSAIAVGLAAVTYFILGQIGLVLIGAFGGITLFVAWESRNPEVARAVHGEKGYVLLDRLLEVSSREKVEKEKITEDDDAETLAHSFDDFQPDTRDALHEFVDAVIRDYVDWWYGPIVPSDTSFPVSCRKVFTKFVLSFSNTLRRKRPADAFVDFVTHSCSIVIVFFTEMASAYAELPVDSHMTAADAIYNYLATHNEAPLSNLLNQRQQAAKFKMVAEDLLGFLEKPAYDCDPARVFLREILSTVILEGTLQTCSKAEWINAWIVYLLESGETDLSQAIDEAIQDQKTYGDIDGNVGNIGLSTGNRSSYELNRQRRKDMVHKKKLSKADEEMERATEEMKRLNEMIAEADKNKPAQQRDAGGSGGLNDGMKDNDHDLDSSRKNQTKSPSLETPRTSMAVFDSDPRSPQEGKFENANKDGAFSPGSQSSHAPSSASNPSPPKNEPAPHQPFTSFDQFVPPGEEESEEAAPSKPPPLTIHNASIIIHDDGTADNGKLRSKPNWEYLVQVEPASSHHSGWMVMKTYAQFESLHESLRRIATISGAMAFLETHAQFPGWHLHTRSSLRGEIERYMRTACAEKPLAESEAMKRFLDRAQDPKGGLNRGFSFNSMGKGMMDAIQNTQKGALDGGKLVMGELTGVFGNIGTLGRRSTNASSQDIQTPQNGVSNVSRPMSLPPAPSPRTDTAPSMAGSRISRDSLDSQRSSIVAVQPGKIPPMDRRASYQMDADFESSLHPSRADREPKLSLSAASSRGHSRASSVAAARSPLRSSSEISLSNLKLPPLPNEITDDYDSPVRTRTSTESFSRFNDSYVSPTRTSISDPQARPLQTNGASRRPVKNFPPLSEQETRVAVEILFAVINELYTLSSAWNFRRTLLTAAKSFLLRPGNPSLVSIQSLIQQSVLDNNTSDDGLAAHIRKLRENSLPTEEERKAWPAELTTEEKEELRAKARKLFIQSSVPAALMGIMGQSATNEALGRVFDCLQIEEVARGLMFGLMLQAIRVVTH